MQYDFFVKVDKLSKCIITFKNKLKIKNLSDLEIFIKTAESGGLSSAARKLDLSPAVASAGLKRLESDLGVMLFVRTTRSMRLTLEGERLLSRCRPLMEELEIVEEEVVAGHYVISGDLQISMPSDLGRNVILPWLDEFQSNYSEIRLRVQISDRIANMYKDPVDLAIRYGKPPDSSMVALPLVTSNRRVLCASPQYIAKHGLVKDPQDLVKHNCLCLMIGDTLHNHWQFIKDIKIATVEVRGNRLADDSDTIHKWAVEGFGVCYRSRIDIHQDVIAGRLRIMCEDWQGESIPLYMICTDRRQLTPMVRLLREFLERKFHGLIRN